MPEEAALTTPTRPRTQCLLFRLSCSFALSIASACSGDSSKSSSGTDSESTLTATASATEPQPTPSTTTTTAPAAPAEADDNQAAAASATNAGATNAAGAAGNGATNPSETTTTDSETTPLAELDPPRPTEIVTGQAAPQTPPNAEGQTPISTRQTRAPAPPAFSRVKVETFATGLSRPWALEALPGGRFIVTEKSGKLRVVQRDGSVSEPLPGVPSVVDRDQGGLLDVALASAQNGTRQLCLAYSEPREQGKNATAVTCADATITADTALSLSPFKQLFQQQPAWSSTLHFGSRIVFVEPDLMFITTGERSDVGSRVYAQDVSTTLGKVVRIKRDGTSPADNPFAAQGGPAAQVWSYGHRNLQAATLDARSRLWTVEHGPRGGDELNLPQPGKNYGWPVITYGEDYSGAPIGDGITQRTGMEQPVYYWDPVIAPSGMAIYRGNLFPDYKGNVLIGGLVAQALVRLVLNADDQVIYEERIPLHARIRDVTEGPDGAIYVVTDETSGKLLRLTPVNAE